MDQQHQNKVFYPLVDSSYGNEELVACIETLMSGQLTMGPRVFEFEKLFAEKVGAPFAVMCNSGSSANLLSVAALVNPQRKRHLCRGDKVAVPAVCWSTSVWPIVQMGLIPVMVDVDVETLNISIKSLKEAVKKFDIKAVMMVHILGNSTNLAALMEIVENNDLVLIEDTCESLGSVFDGNWLGTLGSFGTFSMYFSHHMTTIEGGMVIAKTQEDADLLKCLRAHGWSREQSNRLELEDLNPNIDPRFLFVNMGFNLRPMEIQAAFGLEQIKRLDTMNKERRSNVHKLRNAMTSHEKWRGQFAFPTPSPGLIPSWFGFPIIVTDKCNASCRSIVQSLMDHGVDTRPIVSGNFALQPAVKLFDIEIGLGPFSGAQVIHDKGIFIGCHSKPLDSERVSKLCDVALSAADGGHT